MGLDHHRVQFSILVVAYNRKEFLLNAVNSALNQTIEKSEFEVIVIKNFEDEKIDQEIAGLEIANILSDKASLGEKIIQGTLAAHGEYICLLEDDDQFSSHKLETIQKFVSEDVCFIQQFLPHPVSQVAAKINLYVVKINFNGQFWEEAIK